MESIIVPDHRSVITLTCSTTLRARWPEPLAYEWRAKYPKLFDDDDVRITLTGMQRKRHFNEWFSAIYLCEEMRVYSLVEKYAYKTHPRKWKVIDECLSEAERCFVRRFKDETGGGLPDLFVYDPRSDAYWFAEVKGPGDCLSARQKKGHDTIHQTMGVPVQIIEVKHKVSHSAY